METPRLTRSSRRRADDSKGSETLPTAAESEIRPATPTKGRGRRQTASRKTAASLSSGLPAESPLMNSRRVLNSHRFPSLHEPEKQAEMLHLATSSPEHFVDGRPVFPTECLSPTGNSARRYEPQRTPMSVNLTHQPVSLFSSPTSVVPSNSSSSRSTFIRSPFAIAIAAVIVALSAFTVQQWSFRFRRTDMSEPSSKVNKTTAAFWERASSMGFDIQPDDSDATIGGGIPPALFEQILNRLHELENFRNNAQPPTDTGARLAATAMRVDAIQEALSDDFVQKVELSHLESKLVEEVESNIARIEGVISALSGASSRKLTEVDKALAALADEVRTLHTNIRNGVNAPSARRRTAVAPSAKFGIDGQLSKPSFDRETDDDAHDQLLWQLWRDIHLGGTGRLNWAQELLGASIVQSHTTQGLNARNWVESGLRWLADLQHNSRYRGLTYPVSKPPSVVLDNLPPVPGSCFAFRSKEPADITIHLAQPIVVTGVGIEHAHPDFLFDNSTVPKTFEVWSWAPTANSNSLTSPLTSVWRALFPTTPATEKFMSDAVLLGKFTFLYPEFRMQLFNIGNGERQQHHQSNNESGAAQITSDAVLTRRITFRFLDNNGSPLTCVYRLRVHGNPSQPLIAAP